MRISLTDFARNRHFDPEFAGTHVPCTPQEFGTAVNKFLLGMLQGLEPGYADFCKHLFIPNWWGAKAGVVRVTSENEHLLRTEYVARREGELPILTRHFPRGSVDVEASAYLDVILYSSEQLESEGIEILGDWGVVSINSCEEARENPMKPITMMRNALGKREGGSGVPLDIVSYGRAVAYWTRWATVK